MKIYKNLIAAAGQEVAADLVIKNGKIVDVFNLQIIDGDVAITDGIIVGIGRYYRGNTVINANGRYICPSFIDSHIHIESSMTTPRQFAQIVIPHGITTVITDPHEIANVCGKAGIQFILDDSEHLPLDVKVMLPSCVPATPFETSGASLHAKDLKSFYDHPRVIGLAEIMDFPSVKSAAPEMIAKLHDATQHGLIIDGHGAGIDHIGINIYRTANILTDHECTAAEEALSRISRGMYVQIREGSAAKNLRQLISCVTERNSHRFLLCTDDKHLDELIEEGSIDHSIRLAVELGCDPIVAIQMASINVATCYNLPNQGAIAPGHQADFLLLDDLATLQIAEVYKQGELVASKGKYVGPHLEPTLKDSKLTHSVHLVDLKLQDFQIPLKTPQANLIEIIPNSIETNHLIETVNIKNGFFVPSIEQDQLKLAVVERHLKTGNVGLGIIKGLRLKTGAVATSIAHDSHHLMAVATNDEDLLMAIKELERIQGGIVVIKDQKVLTTLALPIGGLMSGAPIKTIQSSLKQIEKSLLDIGFNGQFDFLLTLAFLSLPVIPELKLTDRGLFNVKTFKHIPVQA